MLLLDVGLAVAVQSLMLVQVSLGYLAMWLRWRRRRCGYEAALPPAGTAESRLAVVVPAYRERDTIGDMLRRLAASAARPDLLEVVVVDAGGKDGTIEIAMREFHRFREVKVAATAGGGRGPAVAAGAAAATAPLLLFAHADTLLPKAFDDAVRKTLATSPACAFRFKVNRDSIRSVSTLPFVVMEVTVRLRSTLLQLPFGDQAIGISARAFRSLGGTGDLARVPILEDYILVQRLRVLGICAARRTIAEVEGEPALCDGRRWRARSVWRVNLTNQQVMLLYNYGGYSPDDIFRLYYGRPAR